MKSAAKSNEDIYKWEFPETIKFPDLWYNEAEIYSALQPFKQARHIAPALHDQKTQFWRSLIEQFSLAYHVCVISCDELTQSLSKKFADGEICAPKCLRYVLANWMHTEPNSLIKLAQYNEQLSRHQSELAAAASSTNQSLLGKLSRLSWNFIAASWHYYNRATASGSHNGEELSLAEEEILQSGAHLPGNQEALLLCNSVFALANRFLRWLSLKEGRLLVSVSPAVSSVSAATSVSSSPECCYVIAASDYNRLLAAFCPHTASRTALDNYLAWSAKFVQKHEDHVIVMLPPSQNAADSTSSTISQAFLIPQKQFLLSSSEVSPAITLYKLVSVETKLNDQLNELETKISKLRDQARALVKSDKREALLALRRAKVAQKRREQIYEQLNKIEQIREELDRTNTSRSVLEALSQGGRELQDQLKQVGGKDRVEDAMDSVQDAMQDAADLQKVFEEPMGGTDSTGLASSTIDLEKELDDLLNLSKEEEEIDEISKALAALPSVDELPEPQLGAKLETTSKKNEKENNSSTVLKSVKSPRIKFS